MCGRFTNRLTWQQLVDLYELSGDQPALNLAPRYNIAPTQNVPVLCLKENGSRRVAQMRWGLVPSWSDGPDSKYSMINARAETVAEKPAFRGAFKARRCLVPADGFYEWKKTGDGKQPYHIAMKDGRPFSFAGLWEHWEPKDNRSDDDEPIDSFSIIVTEANDVVGDVHERMPVILDEADYGLWLDGGSKEDLLSLLAPFPDEDMIARPVSKRVNSPANDEPSVVEPLNG